MLLGCPWHGVVQSDVLTTTLGSIEREWIQPDSGDCLVVKAPDAAPVPRTPAELARDAALGHDWTDYALMSGWINRQLYGTPLPNGERTFVYIPQSGFGWKSVLNLAVNNTGLSGSISFTRCIFGEGEVQTVSGLSLGLSWGTNISGNSGFVDIIAVSESGDKVLLGIWPGRFGTTQPINYSKPSPWYRGRAKVDELSSSGVWSTYFSRVVHPYQYALLELSGGDASDNVIVGSLTLVKSYSDVTQILKNGASTPISERRYLFFQTISGEPVYDWRETNSGPGTLVAFLPYEGATRSTEWETDSIVGGYFEGSVLKWVTVRSYVTFTTTYSYDLAPTGTATATDHTRFFDHVASGYSSLRMDGVEVSRIDLSTVSSTQNDVTPSNTADGGYSGTTTGSSSIDGVSLYSETRSVPEEARDIPIYIDTTTPPWQIGVSATIANNHGWNTLGVHGMMYCFGAYGFALDTNFLVPAGGVARGVYSGGVVSTVTKEREASFGFIASGSGYTAYVYENTLVSHHPITGDVRLNSGVWV